MPDSQSGSRGARIELLIRNQAIQRRRWLSKAKAVNLGPEPLELERESYINHLGTLLLLLPPLTLTTLNPCISASLSKLFSLSLLPTAHTIITGRSSNNQLVFPVSKTHLYHSYFVVRTSLEASSLCCCNITQIDFPSSRQLHLDRLTFVASTSPRSTSLYRVNTAQIKFLLLLPCHLNLLAFVSLLNSTQHLLSRAR
jgi:hypothetical protein